MKLLTLIGLIALTTLANAQQIVMLTVGQSDGTNFMVSEITVESDQYVEVLGLYPMSWPSMSVLVERPDGTYIQQMGYTEFRPTDSAYIEQRKFAGPVVVRLLNGNTQVPASCTLEISPGQYPPGKSAVIGERDGPMKCTLEESTDLVNWTQSTSGQTHSLTNANAKKFFRIKLEQDVGP